LYFFEFTAARSAGQGLFQQPGLLLFSGERVAEALSTAILHKSLYFQSSTQIFKKKLLLNQHWCFFMFVRK